jgi:hypothetical protein
MTQPKEYYLQTGKSQSGLNASRKQTRLDSSVKGGLNQNIGDVTTIDYLLMQDGSYLLQQNGDKIILNG